MDAPTNVLVADLENGCQVFAKWTAPAGTPQGYNVYIASSELGTYNKLNFYGYITDTNYTIGNLNLGEVVYVKVSAIDELGDETALSTVGEDAQIDTSIAVTLFGEAKLGDVIAEGAYFSAPVPGGVLVMQVPAEFTFDGIGMLWELDDDNYVELQTDRIVFVLDGQTVAEVDRQGWYIRGYKSVLTTLGAVADNTDAPFEWDVAGNTLWVIHITSTDMRMFGIDVDGNLYLLEHDAQQMFLGASTQYGIIEDGNEIQCCDGFYVLAAMDRDTAQFMVRGKIVEGFSF